MANYIAHFISEEFGIEALVVSAKGREGYNVVFRDTDADETIVTLRYPTVDAAISKAARLANVTNTAEPISLRIV
jgi:hypothetical protein